MENMEQDFAPLTVIMFKRVSVARDGGGDCDHGDDGGEDDWNDGDDGMVRVERLKMNGG